MNEKQDEQIEYINDITITLEKEIESYAFFTNEFNKIYLNAKEFMVRFEESLNKLEIIEKRDEALWNVVTKLLNAFIEDYSSIEVAINDMGEKLQSATSEILSWLEYSLMFVNEVKAYNLSLRAYNEEMDKISQRCDNIDKIIQSINVNF